jgi:hypothetical protein
MNRVLFALPLLVAAALAPACSSDPTPTQPTDAGTDGTNPDGGAASGFAVTVSGEDLSVNGYDFKQGASANDDPPPFVDGWAIEFTHVIITVANVKLNEEPDKNAGDPTQVGAEVGLAAGPFAVDAHIGGPIVGKSGSPDEKTVQIATFPKKKDGSAFDPKARYAFSYDLVNAAANATQVNLDAEGKTLYADMVTKGYSMLLAGKATFKGPAPSADVFKKMPPSVKFTLGLKNPSSYVNCRNTDLQEVGGEFPRGVQAKDGAVTIAQITIHTDHAFWSRLNVEGTELHFDPIAGMASTYGAVTPAEGVVTIDDLVNVDVTGFKVKDGTALPDRSLVADYTAQAGQLKFDPNGTTFSKANSFAAYLSYSAASGGHLNADGECEVKNNFTP